LTGDASRPSFVRQAIILAAGEGRRLRPITDVTPKPLVPFFGRALVDWALAKVRAAGVERVAVNAFHLADQLAAHLPPDVHLSREPMLLGTGGAVRQLRGWLHPEPFYVVNSDAVFEAPLTVLTQAPSLLVTREPTYASERRVVGTERWEALSDRADAFTFCGVTLADDALPERLPDGASCILRQGFLPYLDRLDVRLVETTAFFADTGTPRALIDAHVRGLPYVRSTCRGT